MAFCIQLGEKLSRMDLKIIKDNKELLNVLKNYKLKGKSSLEGKNDLDIISPLKNKLNIKKILIDRGGHCFLDYKCGDMKIILPLEKKTLF